MLFLRPTLLYERVNPEVSHSQSHGITVFCLFFFGGGAVLEKKHGTHSTILVVIIVVKCSGWHLCIVLQLLGVVLLHNAIYFYLLVREAAKHGFF